MSNQDQPLAELPDRSSFRIVRRYPHPIAAVWAAVSEPEELSAWAVPAADIDLRPGGRVSFSFGAPDDPYPGTISALEPPSVVHYSFDNGAGLRFELAPINGGTELTFTHVCPPDLVFPGDATLPVATQPGGPGTPFAGVMAGWDGLLSERLAKLLDGERSDVGPPPLDRVDQYRTLLTSFFAG
jgi:uncharacterized protein YndB with AHSA1/START domain